MDSTAGHDKHREDQHAACQQSIRELPTVHLSATYYCGWIQDDCCLSLKRARLTSTAQRTASYAKHERISVQRDNAAAQFLHVRNGVLQRPAVENDDPLRGEANTH